MKQAEQLIIRHALAGFRQVIQEREPKAERAGRQRKQEFETLLRHQAVDMVPNAPCLVVFVNGCQVRVKVRLASLPLTVNTDDPVARLD